MKDIKQRWLEESQQMDETFSIYKKDDDKRLVFGWASVSITVDGETLEDRQHDMIEPEDLEEAAYEYVLNFRDTGEEHLPGHRKKGKLVESCVFTKEKQKAMGIPEGILPVAWWIGFKIDDEDTWERVKNGTYKMFSIEGKAERQEIEKHNPYHDARGRFTSANGVGAGSTGNAILTNPSGNREILFTGKNNVRNHATIVQNLPNKANKWSNGYADVGQAKGDDGKTYDLYSDNDGHDQFSYYALESNPNNPKGTRIKSGQNIKAKTRQDMLQQIESQGYTITNPNTKGGFLFLVREGKSYEAEFTKYTDGEYELRAENINQTSIDKSDVAKYNHYHDAEGKFTTKEGVGSGGSGGGRNDTITEIRGNKTQQKRDRDEKLTEKEFYRIYSAHKLDLRNKGNVDEQIENIKEEGFKGDGGFGSNVMPASVNNVSRVTEEQLLASGKTPEGIERMKENLRSNERYIDGTFYFDISLPVAQYAGRKGDRVMFVSEADLDISKYAEKVKQGYKPRDYEFVTVERDFQPYYELYSKAYDQAHGKTAKSFEEILKFNPYHDSRGRFSTENGAISMTVFTSSVAGQKAIANIRDKAKASGEAIGRGSAATGEAKKPKAPKKPKTPGEKKQKKHKDETNLYGWTGYDAVSKDLNVPYEEAKNMVDAVYEFTAFECSNIRNACVSSTPDPYYADLAYYCNAFIEKSPKWKGGEIFRGIDNMDESVYRTILQDAAAGRTIDMRGVSSWTSDMQTAKDFGGGSRRILFHAPDAGTKGTSVKHLSKYPGENEVMMSSKAIFTPKKIVKEDDIVHIYGKFN